MHWYLTVTHISDCVTLITMRLICKCYKNGLCNIVAVACGARLSCSVFMVYSLLLSMALVARAPI